MYCNLDLCGNKPVRTDVCVCVYVFVCVFVNMSVMLVYFVTTFFWPSVLDLNHLQATLYATEF
jgi:hypothetical protein